MITNDDLYSPVMSSLYSLWFLWSVAQEVIKAGKEDQPKMMQKLLNDVNPRHWSLGPSGAAGKTVDDRQYNATRIVGYGWLWYPS